MEHGQRVTSASRLSLVWTLAVMVMVFAAACDDGKVPADAALVADVAQVGDAAPGDGPVSDGQPVVVDAPSDVDLPPPPPPDAGPVLDVSSTLDSSVVPPNGNAAQVAAYIAKSLACPPPVPNPLGPSTVNAYLQQIYGRGGLTASYIACLGAGTAGCSDLATCMGMSFGSGYCTTYTSSCAGNIETSCNPGPPSYSFIVDCKKAYGATCMTHPTVPGITLCSKGKTCSGTSSYYCSGNQWVTCLAGIESIVLDCAWAGAVCRNNTCTGPGGPCTGAKSTCDGPDTIAYCINGYRLRVKCSPLGTGFSCKPSAVTGARCQQGTACDPDTASGTETCTGSMLNVCNAGKKEQVDCKALGFSGCASGNCTP
jgi:hypothetical protein